jgi:hypothetical protein
MAGDDNDPLLLNDVRNDERFPARRHADQFLDA